MNIVYRSEWTLSNIWSQWMNYIIVYPNSEWKMYTTNNSAFLWSLITMIGLYFYKRQSSILWHIYYFLWFTNSDWVLGINLNATNYKNLYWVEYNTLGLYRKQYCLFYFLSKHCNLRETFNIFISELYTSIPSPSSDLFHPDLFWYDQQY